MKTIDVVKYHKDGSVWSKGQTTNEIQTGYWEWYRKDGTLMRSGYFRDGKQLGEWTTYDKKGKPYKVTHFSFEHLGKLLKK